MIAPLKSMTVTPGGAFGIRRVGSGLPDSSGTLRHIGVDLRASVGTPVYAPAAGTVTLRDDIGLKLIEIKIGTKLHRFLHLNKNILSVGQSVKQGQLIGYSGDTGNVAAHLHWDVRKAGTAWNASYYNYEDPMKLLTNEEEDEMVTADGLNVLFRFLRGDRPSDSQKQKYIGKVKFDVLYKQIKEGNVYKGEVAKAKQGTLNEKAHLPKEIREVYHQ